jgi:REP element-mobilizing transposase RayT
MAKWHKQQRSGSRGQRSGSRGQRSGSCGSTSGYVQLALPCRGRGGYRPGSGRRRSGRAGVPHRQRPVLGSRFPVHVTLRARADLPSLRLAESRRALVAAIEAARDRFGCKIVHFSIQSNHVHLLCEANDQTSLSRGLRGLLIRMARGLNRAHARRGSVWADRYHERILRSPREVRGALVYVLGNWRHHGGDRYPLGCIDPCSSAAWFDGFLEPILPAPALPPQPVAPARTWLLASGYQRYRGRLSVDEAPWRARQIPPTDTHVDSRARRAMGEPASDHPTRLAPTHLRE